MKSAFLPSGAFKDNAISNRDRSIQATLYSRGGFIDAINNYEISVLECISLDESLILLKKWPFKITKWDEREMVKKIIQKTSASWYIADKQSISGFKDKAKRGIFHSLRILNFGMQLKKHKKIIDFSVCNELYKDIQKIELDEFDTRNFIPIRDELIKKLRN